MAEHQYGEAFCLMKYRCPNGHELTIWNSRNGVTPFMIRCRADASCGAMMEHDDWDKDEYAPNHVPKLEDWIFYGKPESPRIQRWGDRRRNDACGVDGGKRGKQ